MSVQVSKTALILGLVVLVSCSKPLKVDYERQMAVMKLSQRVQELYLNLNSKNFEKIWEMAGPNVKSDEKKEEYIKNLTTLSTGLILVLMQSNKIVEVDYPLAVTQANVFYNIKGEVPFHVCEKTLWRHVYSDWYFMSAQLNCNFELTKDQRVRMKK